MAGEIDLYCPKCGKIAHRVNLLGMPEEYQQKVLTVLKMLRDRRNN